MIPKRIFPFSSSHAKLVWSCLLGLTILTLVAACGGSSGSTNNSPTPTATTVLISSAPTDTPTSAGSTPTSAPTTPSQSTPTPTATTSQPTPTPTTPPRPTPTPTPRPRPSPTPTPKPSPTPTPPPKVTVSIITLKNGKFAFSPASISIVPGTIVTWVNTTIAPHTVTGGPLNSNTINPGQSYSFKFTGAGTFAYHCNFHPYMTAQVIVT